VIKKEVTKLLDI